MRPQVLVGTVAHESLQNAHEPDRVGDRVVGDYSWDEMRFSVSWKAYCFRDEAERESWRTHERDLSLDQVLDTLCNDLRQRGRIGAERPPNRELAEILVDEYVHFPSPTPG